MKEANFLQSALVYLAAATVCVPLASRYRLGSVLGYLAAGCVIGPHGLGLVSDPEATLHFAEFGVVLMLFAIGLELDPAHLWTMRRPVFRGGGLQMLTAALPLSVVVYFLGMSWQASLVVGLALALSSTAVVMQTMSERGLTNVPVGKLSFSILLFQDIAAIPLLAIVPLLAAAQSTSQGTPWWPAARAFLAIFGVVVVGRYVTRPIMRVIAKTGLREVFTAFALLLVFGIAWLMSSVGVSMALGSFLAGVLLASSEYRHALESDIAPFKGLLMGLFFMAVGMSIDFGLLSSQPGTILALVLGYQGLKALSLFVVSRFIGVGKKDRLRFAALMAQGGEFAFVVFGVARGVRLLPGAWDAMLTLAVALSMALTPLLLIVNEYYSAKMSCQASEDDPIESEEAPVIIAGFGRFGQIVGRLLFASGIKATVLDFDPDQIELLRRFDFKVYYGDATRLDLLTAAQAARARLLVVAIDEQEASLRLVDAVREHFPHLQIVARARNVTHWAELRTRGVTVVERETFESALVLGRRALETLGLERYEAMEKTRVFRRHNLKMLEDMLPFFHDEARRTELARSGRAQLESQMAKEVHAQGHPSHESWMNDEEGEATAS